MSTEERTPMSYKRREEILSKESIHYTELAELFGIAESTACSKMEEIKRVVGDRLNIKGRLHVQDYLDWVKRGGDICTERYQTPQEITLEGCPDHTPHSVFTMSSKEIQELLRRAENEKPA